MKKFPQAVKPPKSVAHARTKRGKELVISASLGVGIRILIVAFELLGFFLFESSALLFDALSSLLDVAASLILIFSLRYAARPPDANHPFGHGRLEPLAGLQLGILLVVTGVLLFSQQLFQINIGPQEAISTVAWLFPFVSLMLLEITYRVIMRKAKKHDSPALAADAMHYRVDGLTSLLAMIVLLIGAFYPAWSHDLDHIGALLISFVMCLVGFNASRHNFHQLLDRAPSKEYFSLVQKAAESVKGVMGTEKIRIQQYGPDAHVDIDIEVDPESTVEVAHEISQLVRTQIQSQWPAVRDVTVHIEPYYPNDH